MINEHFNFSNLVLEAHALNNCFYIKNQSLHQEEKDESKIFYWPRYRHK